MKLSNFQTMDPQLLPGLINTALRNDCDNLEDLAKTHDLDLVDFEQRLQEIGYAYVPEQNQVRPTG